MYCRSAHKLNSSVVTSVETLKPYRPGTVYLSVLSIIVLSVMMDLPTIVVTRARHQLRIHLESVYLYGEYVFFFC